MQVFGYDNPVTALVEFEPNFYDLLLIDVNMPLLDGFQLARNLVPRDLYPAYLNQPRHHVYYLCQNTTK